MQSKLRIATIALGVLFTLQGLGWVFVPHRAAAQLGMPALDGLARSTQFGDFAAFFLVLGGSILVGCQPGRARVLYFPAAMLGTAAVCRILAWLLHGAAFAALFIAVETIGALVLRAAARAPAA
ncbi:MAG: hypothetical protein U0802_00595 [Candidatus Binatia bacterium]